MIDEFKRSVRNIISERITSPLSGAFILSWCGWNWKLLYFLIIPDSTLTIRMRMNIVENNYLALNTTILFPLLTTTVLITIYPLIATGALWVSLQYRHLQNVVKAKIDKIQMLSIDQSIRLRMEMQTQEERFQKILESKEREVEILNRQISEYQKIISVSSKDNSDPNSAAALTSAYLEFIKNPLASNNIDKIIDLIERGVDFRNITMQPKVISYFLANDVIRPLSGESKRYELTDRGKYYVNAYIKGLGQDKKNI
jgi:hypothetical protein